MPPTSPRPPRSTPPDVEPIDDPVPLPGFKSPPPPDPTSTLPPDPQESPGPATWSEPAPDEQPDEPQPKTARGSSPASTDEPLDRSAVVGAIATVFMALTTLLHKRFAPKGTLLWLANEPEVDGVSEPLANIVERRNPIGGAASDLADGISAGVAFAGYAIRNIQEGAALATPAGQQHLTGGPVTQPEEQQ